ncbi:hypothetical protein SAY86_022797 [Trapa natans]|uniref:Uncharacterized protein n=1 Tax=Trapa natans TaxID=22666 RepID=A0AAN7R7B3_TRANT|nr:hypothetical protein SAY86_022797 [Trapa natans]
MGPFGRQTWVLFECSAGGLSCSVDIGPVGLQTWASECWRPALTGGRIRAVSCGRVVLHVARGYVVSPESRQSASLYLSLCSLHLGPLGLSIDLPAGARICDRSWGRKWVCEWRPPKSAKGKEGEGEDGLP